LSEAALPRRPSLFRHPDFARLWTAATISLFGTQISQLAIPVIAVLLLGVSPFEVALLGVVEFLPFLLFTLPAGVWVDRLPRRRILIVGDLGRALMLASIPIAYAAGALTIWQLYMVGFVNGILTVFFDVADQSYLPTVIEREDLVEGNSKIQASASTAMVLGQPAGGGIVGLLTAPIAVLVDAVSFLLSALLIFSIKRTEVAAAARASAAAQSAEEAASSPASGAAFAAEASIVAAPEARPSLRREVAEGLRFVLGNRMLRSIAATTGSSNLFSNILFAVFPVYLYRDLGLTPAAVGLFGGVAGAGALIGAIGAARVARRFTIGPTIVGSVSIAAVAVLLIPLAPPQLALPFFCVSGFVAGFGGVVYNINQVSLRQAICPERMLGRMNATMRFIVWGTIPIGALLGGLIATAFGTFSAIAIGAIGGLFAFLPVFFSPVRTLQRIPDTDPDADADASDALSAPAA
jgi:MFS family permease